MKSIDKALTEIGLSEIEADIYLSLLKRGPSLGRDLLVDLNLEKSRFYESINILISKELVYAVGKQRYQKFVAVTPEKLVEILDKKKSNLNEAKAQIEDLMDSLHDYARTMYTKRNVEIIEGEDGFQRWMDARLEAKRGSYIREISSNSHQAEFINDQEKFKEMSLRLPRERLSKGIKMRALMPKSDVEAFPHLKSVETTDPELLKEVRLLPDSFEVIAGFQTYNNKTSFMREYQGEFLGIIIEDKFITTLLNSMFDLIFEGAEKV